MKLQAGSSHLEISPTGECSLISIQCAAAERLEEQTRYAEARKVLSDRWTRVGERPDLRGLDQRSAAELLLRVGSLTGWLGHQQVIEGSQEFARNLLTESMTLFLSLQESAKVAESLHLMAICYAREDRFSEAEALLENALTNLSDADTERRALIYKDRGIFATSAGEHDKALSILEAAVPLFEKFDNHAAHGKFCNAYAIEIKNLWLRTRDEVALDRALIQYQAASYHLEQAELPRTLAMVENNQGVLLGKAKRFSEAHDHIERASRIYRNLKETVLAADTEQSRAEIFYDEGRYPESERAARLAVRVLERAGEKSLLAQALITHGRALARLMRFDEALGAFLKALHITRESGGQKSTGTILLACMGALTWYFRGEADNSTIEDIQSAQTILHYTLHRLEAGLVAQALSLGNKSVTEAARILGLSHQRFINMMKRHPELQGARKQAAKRKPSAFPKPKRDRGRKPKPETSGAQLIVFPHNHVVNVELPPGLPQDGEYFTVRIRTDRLIDLGIHRGEWAVVLRTEVAEGDPIAVCHQAQPSCYSLGYLSRVDSNIYLTAGVPDFEPLVFVESEVSIEGKVVGHFKQAALNQVLHARQTDARLKVMELSGMWQVLNENGEK